MPAHLRSGPESPPSSSNLLTYPEAAEFLGVKIGTVYSLVSQRRIPHVRLSSRLVRFERKSLERFVAERRVDAG